MEQIEWDSLKLKVNAMLDGDAEVQAIPADVSNLARMLCNAGDANPETRDSLEVSVKNMLKPYPGFGLKEVIKVFYLLQQEQLLILLVMK